MAARKTKVYVEHLRHGSGLVIERFECDSGGCLVVQFADARRAFLMSAPVWASPSAARVAFEGAKVRERPADNPKKSKVQVVEEESEPPSSDDPLELDAPLPTEDEPEVDEAELDLPDEEVEQEAA